MFIPKVYAQWIILLLTRAYPAFKTLRFLLRKLPMDDPGYKQWLFYWTFFPAYMYGEYYSDLYFDWIPFYYEARILLILIILPVFIRRPDGTYISVELYDDESVAIHLNKLEMERRRYAYCCWRVYYDLRMLFKIVFGGLFLDDDLPEHIVRGRRRRELEMNATQYSPIPRRIRSAVITEEPRPEEEEQQQIPNLPVYYPMGEPIKEEIIPESPREETSPSTQRPRPQTRRKNRRRT